MYEYLEYSERYENSTAINVKNAICCNATQFTSNGVLINISKSLLGDTVCQNLVFTRVAKKILVCGI